MIHIKGLTKYYTDKKSQIKALDQIDLMIKKGEKVGILGANGAGKTTLIKALCQLISYDEGQILIDNCELKGSRAISNQKIGVLLEGSRNLYYFLTVEENLKYFSLLNGMSHTAFKKKVSEYIEVFGLGDKINQKVNNLSRGMKQKVAIINLLMKDPELLILDEPTLGLDIPSKYAMIEVINELKEKYHKTILLCSHDLQVIEKICDRIIIMKNGRIIEDKKMKEIKDNHKKYKVIIKNKGQDSVLAGLDSIKITEKNKEIIQLICKNINDIEKLNKEDIIELRLFEESLDEYVGGYLNEKTV